MSAKPASISVVADDREPAQGVLAELRRLPQVSVRTERLPVGDYRVDDQLLFERKTLVDLVRSIKDGRLFTQALRLVNAPERGIIVLEGRSADLAKSRMSRPAIQGALTMLALEMGLPILRAIDPAETAGLMLIAARQRRAIATGALPRHGQRPHGKHRLQNHILQGLPGIGPVRAQRLIDHFGSIEAVITAPAAELAATPGIGSNTAALIRWAVEEPAARYAVPEPVRLRSTDIIPVARSAAPQMGRPEDRRHTQPQGLAWPVRPPQRDLVQPVLGFVRTHP